MNSGQAWPRVGRALLSGFHHFCTVLYLLWVGEVLYASGLQKCTLSAATIYSTGDARTELRSFSREVPSLLASFLCSTSFAAHSEGAILYAWHLNFRAGPRGCTAKISSTATVVRHHPAADPRRGLRNARGCGRHTPHHPTVAREDSRTGARTSWRRRVAHPIVTGDRPVGQPVVHPWSARSAGGCRGGDQPAKSCRQGDRTRERHRTGVPRPSGGAPSASQWAVPSGAAPAT